MNKQSDELATFHALCRDNLSSFAQKSFQIISPGINYIHAPYVDAIAYALQRVLQGQSTRLIINVPPRHGKSILASVAFVAFLLGHQPNKKVMVVSHSDQLAVELSNQTRFLMQDLFYASVFPTTKISSTKNTEQMFKTTKQGYRFGVSMGGSVTGMGADILIIDDLLKQEDALSEVKRTKANQYFATTLLSRLNDKKNGPVVIIQQRQHPDDLTGFAMESGKWEVLQLPAIATQAEKIPTGTSTYFERQPGELLNPDREDQETLDNIKQEVGSHQFTAQWQQLPTLPGGNMIQLNWFKRYEDLPPLHHCECFVQSWDTAVTAAETSCYSVCTTWLKKGDEYFLVDVFREKLEYPSLRKAVSELDIKYKPKGIIIENTHIGHALWCELRNSKKFHYHILTPDADKVARAAQQTAKIEAGRVYIPAKSPWVEAFEKEIQQFPMGKYDDQVDSMSQFLRALDYGIPGVTFK